MDATGHTFPVRIDGECRSHIYNSAEICLIDHLPSLMQIGISEVLIDARGRTGTYTRDMIRLYQEALQLAEKGVPANDPRFKHLKDAVKRLCSRRNYCRSLHPRAEGIVTDCLHNQGKIFITIEPKWCIRDQI